MEPLPASGAGENLAGESAASCRDGDGGEGLDLVCRKRGNEDGGSSSSSSPSTSSCRQPRTRRRVRLRRLHRVSWAPRRGGGSLDPVQDLALPLGMSFAAVVAQILNRQKASVDSSAMLDHLSNICVSAVKESLANIYGDGLDSFACNFEKSFGSTLRTLHVINASSFLNSADPPSRSPATSAADLLQEFSEPSAAAAHEQQVTCVSNNVLTAFQRSVSEQVRSNDLREVEIGLTLKRLELKQSQLALSSYSLAQDRVKIFMEWAKAAFRQEKLHGQMLDAAHADLIRGLIDLLVTGLMIMSACFAYGTYVFSYQRITEATSACATMYPGSSWASRILKPMSSLQSTWQFVSCHVLAFSRMCFGVVMILAVAWLIFQRSAASTGPSMPITFNVMLLGAFCGFTGKLCVEALGGDGFFWLLLWEALCFLHFFGNAFPSTCRGFLHGPLSLHSGSGSVWSPYWARRYSFYALLLFVLPISAGLLPFASVREWTLHFIGKIGFQDAAAGEMHDVHWNADEL